MCHKKTGILFGWTTVGRVPKQIYQYVLFFIKREGVVNSLFESLNYKPSPIPSAGLEVRLMLTFPCSDEWILNTLKDFVETFCIYDFTGLAADINSDEEGDFEIDLDVEARTEGHANNSVKLSDARKAPKVSDKATRKLLLGKSNIFIVIDDD